MTCQTDGGGCGTKTPEMVQKLKDLADRFHKDPEGTAHQIGKELQGLLHTAGGNLEQAGETVTAKIHEKPVESSLVALGVGLLVGLLMGRR